MIDTLNIKKDFPIFSRDFAVNKPLVYLDNAATSQKPFSVINSISDFYKNHNANVHRGVHTLSEEATDLYESARKTVAKFIGAVVPEEVTFAKGTTDSLNAIVYSWGVANIKSGDIILTTHTEHHSNLVPWQILAKLTGATLEFIKLSDAGVYDLSVLKEQLTPKVKLLAISHASNVLGTISPIREICKLAHAVGALVAVDGAQAIPHLPVNMQSLNCDFYAFSGHKMLGPTGIGVLYVKRSILEHMEPFAFGGGMIDVVEETTATWAPVPERFEAGTPHISGAIGLAVAAEYLSAIGMELVRSHEVSLTHYALESLSGVSGLNILGPLEAEVRTGLVAFTLNGMHAHDIASILNSENIAVRSGHHCAMPLHTRLNIAASTRASFYLYNDTSDIDLLISGLQKAREILL